MACILEALVLAQKSIRANAWGSYWQSRVRRRGVGSRWLSVWNGYLYLGITGARRYKRLIDKLKHATSRSSFSEEHRC